MAASAAASAALFLGMHAVISYRLRYALVLCIAALCAIATASLAQEDGARSTVPEIALDGSVGPATADFVIDEIEAANARHAPFVILRIDTPGGLSSSMREIVQSILASSIPVIGYVAPEGARAASAGTYILLATHVAAMAPATTLGAATPINIGGASAEPADNNSDDGPDTTQDGDTAISQTSEPDLGNAETKRRKQVNDAVAYIRSLAERRGRNADWAASAVRSAATLGADEAREKNVVDLVAASQRDLLAALDGRTVATASGEVTLATADTRVRPITPDWRTRVLSVVTDPTVAYLLFMIGLVGLAAEALNPGAAIPGVVGAISLITAFYAFNMMPVDLTGAALIALGVLLVVAEAFVPSFGALGLGGVAALLFGSLMLTDTPGYDVSLTVIITIALAAVLILATIVWQFRRARHTRIETGHEGLVGRHCTARHDFEHQGRVWLHGESWRAETDTPVIENQSLVVTRVTGLTVHVRALDTLETSR
ncbi:NfeD family protein [Salinisphaera japonica]|uniref:NfeD family protein n=1 Tax=Salinisphaera japonica TaxID=1304270 RepID=UPI000F4BBABA|nr:nodulation protein NfeD [Salinisphaera japonica]